ncbi:MAG: alpha/beta hydrolase [Ignavibacteriae bacterium]|nr:alpha/beta hydrolase [Ignavibacteriota bacterium]MCB9208356.1 alpha/beta hydrolase [Ignavibacteriales bacterium]MCB9259120.1 alpha/beta hydrolase [Ignavibacteriales bacterium]
MNFKKYCFLILVLSYTYVFSQTDQVSNLADYKTIKDIFYYDNIDTISDEYIKERCKLDLYYPVNKNNFPTIVWFHGGGLSAGEKYIPEELQNKGIAIAAINYRLYPNVKCPAYIEDAAASVAWIFKNIENFGGSSKLIFVSGHSAGGYLTSIIGFDKKWLSNLEIDADSIAGLIPFSGHTITHFTIREERGIPGEQPIIDEFAPLYHVRNHTPPIVLITGDRNIELLGRYEENAYFYRMLKVVGNENVDLYELQGFDHVGMAKPAFEILLKFVSNFQK